MWVPNHGACRFGYGGRRAAAAFVLRKRNNSDGRDVQSQLNVDVPVCVSRFEGSLRAYVEAARDGILDAAIVDRLIVDVDEVRAWADGGNTVEFSFDQLEPLFSLVIGHTPALASAYSVELAEVEHQQPDCDVAVVVHLRQHLEEQMRILGGAA